MNVIKNLPLKLKFSLLFILLVAIPIGIISFIFYFESKTIVKEKIIEASMQLSEQVGSRAENLYNDLNNFTSVFIKDSNLHGAIEETLGYSHDGSGKGHGGQNNIETINNSIKQLMTSKNGIKKISLVLVDGSLFENGMYYKDTSIKDAVEVYRKNIKGTDAGYLSTAVKDKDGKYEISYIREIVDVHNNQYMGFIKVDFSLVTISDMYKDIKHGEGAYQFIYNSTKNKLITHPNPALLGPPFKGFTKEQMNELSFSKGSFDAVFEKTDATVTFVSIPKLDWKIISVIPKAIYQKEFAEIRNRTLVLSFMFIMLAFFSALRLSYSITEPINKIICQMKSIAKGDLNVRYNVTGKDEIQQLGDGFNNMVENIKSLVSEINKASNIVLKSAENITMSSNTTANASKQISHVTHELAQGASQQALTSKEAVEYGNKLSQNISGIRSFINEMAALSGEAKKVSEDGIKFIEKLNTTTIANKEISNQVSESMNELDDNAKRITEIVGVIDSIYGQINLLSLNAAIESARAGEYGRGFGVVSDEIRKLAEQSKDAAKNISDIVKLIDEKTDKTVEAVKNSVEMVEDQVEQSQETSDAFVRVVSSMEEIIKKVYNITSYIEDIVQSNSLVSNSMTNIHSISQDSAASSEEVSASADQLSDASQSLSRQVKELNELASNLIHIVRKFRINS